MKDKQREKIIEKHLVDEVYDMNGKAYKWSSPGNKSVPDRICVFPYGIIAFVEVKASDKKVDPKSLQQKVITFLRNLEQVVLVINSKEQVDAFIEVTKTEIRRRKEVRKNVKLR